MSLKLKSWVLIILKGEFIFYLFIFLYYKGLPIWIHNLYYVKILKVYELCHLQKKKERERKVVKVFIFSFCVGLF